jgi:hypothetical protein
MRDEEKDRLAAAVVDRHCDFEQALAGSRRKYPAREFQSFAAAVRRYIRATRSDEMVHRNVVGAVHGLAEPVLEMSALVADLQRQAAALKDLKAKKGPSTPEAKDRVKYNALRHGFTGQVLIMTPEEHEKFAAFVKGMMTDLAPVGTHETFLANSMAEEAWRLNQIRARCTNLSALGDFDGAGNKYRPMEGQDPPKPPASKPPSPTPQSRAIYRRSSR